jgi:PAS domain S-box-containing protein
MKGLWRPLGFVALLLVLLSYLLLRSASPDLQLRKNVQEELELVELRDAELTRDALLARAGLLVNYDALLRDRANLQAAMLALQRAGRSGTDESGVALESAIEALSHALDDKVSDVEHFKTDDALLRHSVAYLTYTISRLDAQPGARPAMAAAVDDLSSSFLRFIQTPNVGAGAEFKAALDRLAGRGEVDDDLRSLVAHGGLVAELLPRVVVLLRQIVAAPTNKRVSELQAEVETVAGEAEGRAQMFRNLLFFTALVLLGYLVNQFARLRASARHLQRTNDELNREIAERQQAETALRASEERFRAIAESAHDAIISADSRDAIVSWNPGAEAIYGYRADEILGAPFARLRPAHEQGNAPFPSASSSDAAGASSRVGRTLEATGVRKDGSEFPLEATIGSWSTAQGSFVTAIIRDVSARKQLEQTAHQQELKLVQANKMAALGTLVSGVAHEINNPNQMVLLNSSVLADTWRDACITLDAHRTQGGEFTLAGLPYAEMRDAAAGLIRDLNEGARRIDRIVQDLKDFARPQRQGPQMDVNVNDIVHRAQRLLAHLVNKRTRRFQLDLANHLPAVRGDAQQVEQVLVNLIVNALEALPDPSRGVTVTSRRRASDSWVVIEVADEGAGISPEHLQRLCDPFFTTKQDSGGTGLGLSVTFALVQAHGGRLDFDSAPGRGTRVTVSFPPTPPMH